MEKIQKIEKVRAQPVKNKLQLVILFRHVAPLSFDRAFTLCTTAHVEDFRTRVQMWLEFDCIKGQCWSYLKYLRHHKRNDSQWVGITKAEYEQESHDSVTSWDRCHNDISLSIHVRKGLKHGSNHHHADTHHPCAWEQDWLATPSVQEGHSYESS